MRDIQIQVQGLSQTLSSGETLFENISFTLQSGEILGILGPNGSGKSTLLKILLGLQKIEKGSILWRPEREKLKIAYMPQHSSFNQYLNLTVEDILYLSACRDKSHLEQTIEEFSLSPIYLRLFRLLSGGEKQRVLMAMHCLTKPDIWFLDEANKGLDSQGQDQLYHSLKRFAVKQKTPILLIDHNINQTLSLCDQILCLNRTGHYHSKKELLDHQKVRSLYHCEFEHQLIHSGTELWGQEHIHHDDHSSHACEHTNAQTKNVAEKKK